MAEEPSKRPAQPEDTLEGKTGPGCGTGWYPAETALCRERSQSDCCKACTITSKTKVFFLILIFLKQKNVAN